MCNCMLSLKFLVCSTKIGHTAKIEIRERRQVGAYKRLKTMENL